MTKEIEILASIAFFSDLQANQLASIAPLVHPLQVTPGEVLARRDDPAKTIYIIISGFYMVYYAKNKSITLHHRGDIMGWAALVPPHHYKGTAIAITAGEVLTLEGVDFLNLIHTQPVMGEKIMRRINRIQKERSPLIKASHNTP